MFKKQLALSIGHPHSWSTERKAKALGRSRFRFWKMSMNRRDMSVGFSGKRQLWAQVSVLAFSLTHHNMQNGRKLADGRSWAGAGHRQHWLPALQYTLTSERRSTAAGLLRMQRDGRRRQTDRCPSDSAHILRWEAFYFILFTSNFSGSPII